MPLALALSLLLVAITPTAASATALPATIKENTTLTPASNPYTGTSTVESGVTLTVEPGVKLTVGELIVKGTLLSNGTAEAPVRFTGAGEGSSGEWERIKFEPGSGASVLDHTVVANGSWSATKGMIEVVGSSPTIRNSTIRKSGGYGIRIVKGGSPEIANNEFAENSQYAISYEAESGSSGEVNIHGNSVEKGGGGIMASISSSASVYGKTLSSNLVTGTSGLSVFYNGPDIPGDITQNSLSGNSSNVVIAEGTVAHSSTWVDAGTPVALELGVTVASGATLTMAPGLLLYPGHSITVKGTLNAEGTAKEPILFTGPSEKASGEWERIKFEPGSGASVLSHVEAKYGNESATKGLIEIVGSSPTIRNSTIRKSGGYGIRVVKGGSPEIADNEFAENSQYAISYEAESGSSGEVNIHGNSVEKGGGGIIASIPSSASVYGKTLSSNTIMGTTGYGVFYNGPDIPGDVTQNNVSANPNNIILAEGTVAHSSTWTNGGARIALELGVTVASGVTLTVKPGLVLLPGHSITVKGTLNAEGTAKEPILFTGPSEKTSNEWERIKFEPGSGASVLDYVEAKYGNSSVGKGLIEIVGSSPTIQNSTIRKSGGYGIRVTESGAPKIEWNRFRNNGAGGLSYSGTGTLSALHNDWNCASGPWPAGCGESVSANVNWKPAVELPELGGHCRGGETQCPEGADPVSLATGALDYSHRDLLLTNKSKVPLEFSRSYNSNDPTDYGLGPGWSQTGLARAMGLESGEVLVVRQDGRQDLFRKVEGGYEAPSGVTDALTKVEGLFELRTLQNTVYRFDASGRIASITDDHGLKTTYGYNGEGRLASISDPSGQTLTFSYNVANHISTVKDSTGREVKFGYSPVWELETVTDALGGVTKYVYDAKNQLTAITDPRGNVILKNTFDGQGRIIEQKDGLENLWKLAYSENETVVTEPEGGKTTYGFDAQDRVVSEKNQLGHTTTTGYDEAGNVDEIVKPGGAKWQYGYDAKGNLTSVIDPEEGERSYEYDGKNRLESFTDEREETWDYEWSEANDLKKVTDPAEGETTATYNSSGQPLTVIDPDENTTTFTYDTRGNLLTTKDALEHTTTLAYNSRSYLTSKTKPGLEPEEFGRNALGDLLSVTTPEDNKTEYAYNANGLLTKVTDPAEGVWEVKRDAMERPTAYIDPLKQESKISYDSNLRPVKVIDRRGKETSYHYDLANRVTEIVRPEGGDWAFDYDPRDNRIEVVDPRENASTYEFDLLDRMTEAAEPLEAITSYEYDPAGNLIAFTDPGENTTELVYDELRRLKEIDQPLEKATTFTYDGVGNRLTRTTAAGTIELDYDAANRLEEISEGETVLRSFEYDPAGRMIAATDAQADQIEIGYDDDGRATSIDDGRGQTVSREYDSRGNVIEQIDGRGTLAYEYDKLSRMIELTDPQSKALDFDYDPEGNLVEAELPNGVVTTSEFDNAGRLAETTSAKGEATLESLEYDYDPSGNRIGQVDRLSQETAYEYDALNRLIEFDPPGEDSTDYDYDPAGNRTEAGATTFEFNDLNQLTSASNGTTYDYDDAGRLIEVDEGETSTTYGWSVLDELTSVDTGVEEIDFVYDALGRQVLRNDGSTIRPSHYGDLSDLPILDTDAEGEPTMSYVQGPGGLVEQRAGEATSFPLRDAHGDITTLADGEGKVASRQTYDPWGDQLSGPSLEMGWLGAQQRRSDSATELVQMGVRSYSPTLGGFASEDPILGTPGESQSLNRYPYAWDNPLNLYDLDGREVCAGLGPIQGCVDGDGPSINLEPCLSIPIPGVGVCAGTEGTKVCAGPMLMPIAACTDPETAAKYGKACTVDGAIGAAIGLVFGQNLASAISGGALGCGSALLQKALRSSGQEAPADDIDAAGKAWDVAEVLCSISRKC